MFICLKFLLLKEMPWDETDPRVSTVKSTQLCQEFGELVLAARNIYGSFICIIISSIVYTAITVAACCPSGQFNGSGSAGRIRWGVDKD